MNKGEVVEWAAIEALIGAIDLQAEMTRGFIEYSRGDCVVPPVGELILDQDPPGEVHIKYGYVRGGANYVVKIASGFPNNGSLGLATSNGMMLLFDQRSGAISRILLDEGRLTDIRTAAAGALAARTLAGDSTTRIGIIGTGTQGRLQLRHLEGVLGCREVLVCGRAADRLEKYQAALADTSFSIETTIHPQEIAESCDLILTTTPAKEPVLKTDWIRPGTTIVAVGSDTPEKQELESGILAAADLVVCDSIEQCRVRGEVSQALRAGAITEDHLVELGAVLAGEASGRSSEEDLVVADLTGVAVQDLRIAEAVHERLRQG